MEGRGMEIQAHLTLKATFPRPPQHASALHVFQLRLPNN